MECVYGPYRRRDGREIIVYWDRETDTRRTRSYPRQLVEDHLGRDVLPEEHVDHINDDHTDNRIDNLQLLSLAENNRKAIAKNRPMQFVELVCEVCDRTFEARKSQADYASRSGNAQPVCSRSCAATKGGIASGVSRRDASRKKQGV